MILHGTININSIFIFVTLSEKKGKLPERTGRFIIDCYPDS